MTPVDLGWTVEPYKRAIRRDFKEDAMRKVSVILLLAVLAVIGFAAPGTTAKEKKASTGAAAKESRWHGIIIRGDKDASFFDVRKGNIEKRIYYDSSTKWTKGKEGIGSGDVKEGDDVICLGKYNDKKFVATRIDLRTNK
jgi:hypothetical protein